MELTVAAGSGKVNNVKHLLSTMTAEDINRQDNTCGGMTALHCACLNNQTKVVKLMLKCKKVDPNHVSKNGNSVLIQSVLNEQLNMVKLLVANEQIDINHAGEGYNTALHFAIKTRNIKIVKILLSSPNINILLVNSHGQQAFYDICNPADTKLLKAFLSIKRVPMSWRDSNYNTILHIAYRDGDLAVIKEMRKYYSLAFVHDCYNVNKYGLTPTDIARLDSKLDLTYYAKQPISNMWTNLTSTLFN